MKRRTPGLAPSDITPEEVFMSRRSFLKALGAAALFPRWLAAKSLFDTDEKLTPFEDIAHYNNYVEFSQQKEEVAGLAKDFKVKPWTVSVEGQVKRPKVYDIDELLKRFPLEERIYRHRCVEAWSMVVPWQGFPLSQLLKAAEPTAKARFVAFTALFDPKRIPRQAKVLTAYDGLNRPKPLHWPYVEGLRLDEAMHPLTMLVSGVYGKPLPNQNGAPLRLVVPWKYGFKGIKAIVKIRLLAVQPPTTWGKSFGVGFYANVNPAVDLEGFPQAKERRIGDLFKRDTLAFNGYAEQVAGLYKGMDLRVYR